MQLLRVFQYRVAMNLPFDGLVISLYFFVCVCNFFVRFYQLWFQYVYTHKKNKWRKKIYYCFPVFVNTGKRSNSIYLVYKLIKFSKTIIIFFFLIIIMMFLEDGFLKQRFFLFLLIEQIIHINYSIVPHGRVIFSFEKP